MTTSDGISTDDWDTVHELTVEIFNATTTEERATFRSRLFAFLDELETKYGTLPSILATRADYIDDTAAKAFLLHDAYSIAEIRGDNANLLYVSHSLAEFYLEERSNQIKTEEWLERMQQHLVEFDDPNMAVECERLRKKFDAWVGR